MLQCAAQVAHQMKIVETQHHVELMRVGRKRFHGRSAENEVRERAGGVFSFLGDCDHAGGNIRRKIVFDAARKPDRRCPGAATQFQYPVIRIQQGTGPLQRALISGLIRNPALCIFPSGPVPETGVVGNTHGGCSPDGALPLRADLLSRGYPIRFVCSF
ncbi:hypothetical protein D3C86_1605290 [compost metagenome]